MRTKKQKIFLSLKLFLLVLFLGVIVAFSFRNSILENVISKIETKLDHDYQCDFSIEKAEFIGLSNLEFQKITLVPKDADTLISIENLKTSVNFWQLFVGDIQLGKLEINEGFIQLVKNKNGKNFDAFLKNNDEKKSDDKPSYAK